MPGRKLDAGAIWDHLERECPGQTLSRENFVSECKRLSNPHSMQQDLTRMTMERGKRRTMSLYSRNKIDKALKGE